MPEKMQKGLKCGDDEAHFLSWKTFFILRFVVDMKRDVNSLVSSLASCLHTADHSQYEICPIVEETFGCRPMLTSGRAEGVSEAARPSSKQL